MVKNTFQMLATYAGLATDRLHREEAGVTAIEYGLIAALVAVVIIVGATALGVSLNELFGFLGGTVSEKTPAS